VHAVLIQLIFNQIKSTEGATTTES